MVLESLNSLLLSNSVVFSSSYWFGHAAVLYKNSLLGLDVLFLSSHICHSSLHCNFVIFSTGILKMNLC